MGDNIKNTMTSFKENIISKMPNINKSSYLIFLFIGIFLIILLLILKYSFKQIYYVFNQNLVNLIDFEKIYKTSPTLVSIVDNPNYNTHALRDFFVKTAYNCCAIGEFKNTFVDLCALKQVIRQGVRALDFQIYSVDDKPVIAVSTIPCDYTDDEDEKAWKKAYIELTSVTSAAANPEDFYIFFSARIENDALRKNGELLIDNIKLLYQK